MRAAHRMAYAALLIALLTLALPWLNAGSPDGAAVAAAGGSPVPRSVEPVEPGPTPFDAETTVVEPPGDDWSDGGSTAQPSSNEGDRKGPKPEPTPTADPTPAPTADPTPAPTPDLTDPSDGVPSAPGELLISAKRLQDLPTSGSAWDYLVKVAHADWPAPELDDQDSRVNVMALAAALVYARTGEPAMA
ncbi:MAG: hypothetical protein FIA92_03535, partial [Chloroflexi bacterium]|nr:hypothetical protein [Chloroflexota bacterium]